ncbi:MAG TPA: bifunctional oligoribonuclease/PAP phosphatase NrnA [Candidatus Pacearchaeota archaeon]|nr:bifunctional oligoribonuclease/PAP phosphatase NrnA [Candidatus Pacearchaeota archaeon]HPZ74588.1 bifunctional oligoribonuclease/PAP phosphatase NrnA [Candidatus Pacearchaeota archaeon]HQD89172.1 bifunctional oligoribonuclease/PAP phosphatase NrnA [Candidatus Pacearchaeota archaeon]
MKIDNKKFNRIKKEIQEAKRILILSHRAPDGDAVGSSLALHTFLKRQKKKSVVFISQPPQFLKFLPGFDEIQRKPLFKNDNFDLIFALDYANKERLEKPQDFQLLSRKTITIDHHISGKRVGKIKIVDSKASSTTEVLYYFFKFQKTKIDKKLATLLLTGILTDTVGLSQSGQNHRTVEKIVGELAIAGGDLFKIMAAYQNFDFKRAKILAKFLERAESDEKLNLIYSYLLKSDFNGEKGLNLSEPPMFPDFLSSIGEAKVYITLIEQKDRIKVSLRSRNGINVAKIAKKFGGGGHKYAAGCKIKGDIFEVLKKIKKELKKNF